MDGETRDKWKVALVYGGVLLVVLLGIIVVDHVLLTVDKESFCDGRDGIVSYPVCERNSRYVYCQHNVSVPIDCERFS